MKKIIRRLIAFAVTIGVILIGLAMIGVLSRNADDTRENRPAQIQSDYSDYQEDENENQPSIDDDIDEPEENTSSSSSSSSSVEEASSTPDEEQDDNSESTEF